MIVLYPVVLVAAAMLAVSRGAEQGGRGWPWFGAWALAGGLFTFSFLTGLSIGLLLLPVAALALLGAAWAAPHAGEMLGFLPGLGAVLLVVAWVNRDGHGVDSAPWLLAGVAAVTGGVVAYAVLRRRRQGAPPAGSAGRPAGGPRL